MPGFHHAVLGALGGDGQAVELARQADGEIADVDHLLNLAEALGRDLAGFQRHEAAEIVLGGAQFLADQTHEFAAPGSRHLAPGLEGLMGAADGGFGLVGAGFAHMGDHRAGNRRHGGPARTRKGAVRNAEALEDGAGIVGCRHWDGGDGFQSGLRGHGNSRSMNGVRAQVEPIVGKSLQQQNGGTMVCRRV